MIQPRAPFDGLNRQRFIEDHPMRTPEQPRIVTSHGQDSQPRIIQSAFQVHA